MRRYLNFNFNNNTSKSEIAIIDSKTSLIHKLISLQKSFLNGFLANLYCKLVGERSVLYRSLILLVRKSLVGIRLVPNCFTSVLDSQMKIYASMFLA